MQGSDDETMCLAYKYVSHIKKLRGDLSGAQEMLSAAMEIKEKKGPSKDSMMLALLFAQGSVARDLGNHIEAALLFKRVADAKEEQKPGSLGTGTVLHALGDAYTAAGDYESAEISYRRSLAILKKHKREDDPDVTAEMKSLMNTLHLKVCLPADWPRLSSHLLSYVIIAITIIIIIIITITIVVSTTTVTIITIISSSSTTTTATTTTILVIITITTTTTTITTTTTTAIIIIIIIIIIIVIVIDIDIIRAIIIVVVSIFLTLTIIGIDTFFCFVSSS